MGNSGRSREPRPEGPGLRFFFSMGADWASRGGDGACRTTAVWRTIRDFEGKGYSATFTDVRILICPCWGAGVVLAQLVRPNPFAPSLRGAASAWDGAGLS